MNQGVVSIPDIHIGNMIIAYLKSNEISQAKLARDLKIDSAYLNRLLKKKSIETDRLFDICKVLKYNFFAAFCNDTVYTDGNYIKDKPNLGLQIERRMKATKMTQADFAARLGVTQPDISKILKKTSFDTDKLTNISLILNYNFFQDFYQFFHLPDEKMRDAWKSVLKRNEELVAENTRMKEYLREVYSKMQKFKEDNDVSIDNWDSLVKREGVDVMNMAMFFVLEDHIKKFLDESEQTDSSKTEND